MEDFRAGGAADGTSGDGDPEDAPAPALEPACSSEIFELEKNIRQKVLFGAETPEDAAAEFMQGANKILAENAG